MAKPKSFIKRFFQRSNTFQITVQTDEEKIDENDNQIWMGNVDNMNDRRRASVRSCHVDVKEFNKKTVSNVDNVRRRAATSCVVDEHEFRKILMTSKSEEKRRLKKVSTTGVSSASHSMMFYAVQYRDVNLLQNLFQSNPDVEINSLNEDGIAIIHFAAMVGSTNCLKILKQYGADIDMEDLRGNSPLHYAILMKNFDFAGNLLEIGAKNKTLKEHTSSKKHRMTWL